MDQDRFFHEVDREQAELESINDELQVLAMEARDEEIELTYAEYLQTTVLVLYSFYKECFPDTEWDV